MRKISSRDTRYFISKRAEEDEEAKEVGVVQRVFSESEKDSREEFSGDSMGGLQVLLGMLRAQYLLYHTLHWQAKGDPAYGNHLLFQRLYEANVEQIDSLAEKMVGMYGNHSVDLPEQLEVMQKLCASWCKIEDPHQRGLKSEEVLQATLKKVYDHMKESEELTLGMDDYLMATASEHDTNMYLLQQVLGDV
jgi:DNA-binding ferritin-like protein